MLSDELFVWLTRGIGRAFFEALKTHGLDLRLRDDCVAAFEGHGVVAKISWRARTQNARLEISNAYWTGGESKVIGMIATKDVLDRYLSALPQIRERVNDRHKSPEGRWESDIIRTNRESTPYVVLDRQISSGGRNKKLDVLAVSRDERRPGMIAVEIRRDVDNTLPETPARLLKHLVHLDPSREGLRWEIAASYSKACEQLAELGLPGPEASRISEHMEVEGLIALPRFHPASPYLDRALREAAKLDRKIWFCKIDDENPRIPPHKEWFK
jgi:hypothetical protein